MPFATSSESCDRREPKLRDQASSTSTRRTVFTVCVPPSSTVDPALNFLCSLFFTACGACDAPLYKSTTKLLVPFVIQLTILVTDQLQWLAVLSDSGCGWPAFFEAIPGAVGRNVDRSMFMERIEIVCNNCTSTRGSVTDRLNP